MKKLQRFMIAALMVFLALATGCETDSAPVAGTVNVTVELKGFSDFSEVVVWGENQAGTVSSSSITLKPDALSGSITLPAGDWRIKATVMQKTENESSSIASGSVSVSVVPNNAVSAVIKIENEKTGISFSAPAFDGASSYRFYINGKQYDTLSFTDELEPGNYGVFGLSLDADENAIAEGYTEFKVEKGRITSVEWTAASWEYTEFSLMTDKVDGASSYWFLYNDRWIEWHEGMKVRYNGIRKYGMFCMQARDAAGHPIRLSVNSLYGETRDTLTFTADSYSIKGILNVTFLFPEGEGNTFIMGFDGSSQRDPESTEYNSWNFSSRMPGKHYVEADVLAPDGKLLGTCRSDYELGIAEVLSVTADFIPLPAGKGKFNFVHNDYVGADRYEIIFNGTERNGGFSETLEPGEYELKVTADDNGSCRTVTKKVVIEAEKLTSIADDQDFWGSTEILVKRTFIVNALDGAAEYAYTTGYGDTWHVIEAPGNVEIERDRNIYTVQFRATDAQGRVIGLWSREMNFAGADADATEVWFDRADVKILAAPECPGADSYEFSFMDETWISLEEKHFLGKSGTYELIGQAFKNGKEIAYLEMEITVGNDDVTVEIPGWILNDGKATIVIHAPEMEGADSYQVDYNQFEVEGLHTRFHADPGIYDIHAKAFSGDDIIGEIFMNGVVTVADRVKNVHVDAWGPVVTTKGKAYINLTHFPGAAKFGVRYEGDEKENIVTYEDLGDIREMLPGNYSAEIKAYDHFDREIGKESKTDITVRAGRTARYDTALTALDCWSDASIRIVNGIVPLEDGNELDPSYYIVSALGTSGHELVSERLSDISEPYVFSNLYRNETYTFTACAYNSTQSMIGECSVSGTPDSVHELKILEPAGKGTVTLSIAGLASDASVSASFPGKEFPVFSWNEGTSTWCSTVETDNGFHDLTVKVAGKEDTLVEKIRVRKGLETSVKLDFAEGDKARVEITDNLTLTPVIEISDDLGGSLFGGRIRLTASVSGWNGEPPVFRWTSSALASPHIGETLEWNNTEGLTGTVYFHVYAKCGSFNVTKAYGLVIPSSAEAV